MHEKRPAAHDSTIYYSQLSDGLNRFHDETSGLPSSGQEQKTTDCQKWRSYSLICSLPHLFETFKDLSLVQTDLVTAASLRGVQQLVSRMVSSRGLFSTFPATATRTTNNIAQDARGGGVRRTVTITITSCCTTLHIGRLLWHSVRKSPSPPHVRWELDDEWKNSHRLNVCQF